MTPGKIFIVLIVGAATAKIFMSLRLALGRPPVASGFVYFLSFVFSILGAWLGIKISILRDIPLLIALIVDIGFLALFFRFGHLLAQFLVARKQRLIQFLQKHLHPRDRQHKLKTLKTGGEA